MSKAGFVYVMANRRNGTLYIGVTSQLVRRVYQHREGTVDGFTNRHRLTRLVHYECFGDIRDALAREKQLKKWRRVWKLELIESSNPYWRDLYDSLFPGGAGGPNDAGFPRARE